MKLLTGLNAALLRNPAYTNAIRASCAFSTTSASNGYIENLFTGRSLYKDIYPFPKVINKERLAEIDALREPVKKFMETENDPAKNDEKMEVDPNVIESLKQMGAYGILVPEEYGGLGLNNTENVRIVTECQSDLAIGTILGAHQSIGYKAILLYGTKFQKEKYLPKLATGEHVAAFALTETTAGSDAASVKTRAVLSSDGKHYILNGSKIWISNGDVADIFTVFAKTPGADGKDKHIAFIVERAFGGVTHSPSEKKMGIKSVHSVVVNFDNVKVPVENTVGAVGEGFKVAVNVLNNGRFGMVAIMTGVQEDMVKRGINATKDRNQFGMSLIKFQDIQQKIVTIACDHYISQSMSYMISSLMDLGRTYELESAAGKIFSSEAAWRSCDECIQLSGGMGFMTETGLERILRDLRIFRIFEGANDVLRQFVFLTGARKFKFTYGGSLGLLFLSQMGEKCEQSRRLAYFESRIRAKILQLAATHGKNLIKTQLINRHMADAIISSFGAACVLSRKKTNKDTITDEEKMLADRAFDLCLHRATHSLDLVSNWYSKSLVNSLDGIMTKLIDTNGVFVKSPID